MTAPLESPYCLASNMRADNGRTRHELPTALARRNNGYFIVSSVEGVSFQPRDVPTGPVTARLGAGQLIPGLEEVLAGMRPGSKRRALVPPSAGMPGNQIGLFLVYPVSLLAGAQPAIPLLQGMRIAQRGCLSRPRSRHSASSATIRANPCSLRCKCCACGRQHVQREWIAGLASPICSYGGKR